MRRLTDTLAELAQGDQSREFVATVAAVRTDDLVNLAVLGTLVAGVPALASYSDRRAGDVVQVRARGRQWLVIGRAGTPVATPVSTPETIVSWGTGPPPGAGWHAGTVYVKDHQVYVQVPSSDTATPVPGPALLATDSWAAYQDGHLADLSAPTQGGPPGGSPALTCFYYGTRVAAALARPASSLAVRLARSGVPHGSPGNQDVHLALHSATAPTGAPPNQVAGPVNALALQLGEADSFTVPDDWLDLLASGAARGLSVFYAIPGVDFVIFTSGSGTITVTY